VLVLDQSHQHMQRLLRLWCISISISGTTKDLVLIEIASKIKKVVERNVEKVTYIPSKHIVLFSTMTDGISCNPGKANCEKNYVNI